MSETTPSLAQRFIRVIRSPKRLILAVMERSPLRSVLSEFRVLQRLQPRVVEAERRLELVDVHHEWFAGVDSRANAHHQWLIDQQRVIAEQSERMVKQSERILALERVLDTQRNLLHFQSLQRVAGMQTSSADTPLSLLFDIRITQIERRERGISRYVASLALALGARLPHQVSFLIDPELPLPDQFDELRACGRIVNGAAEISQLQAISHFCQGCVFYLSHTAEDLFPIEIAPFYPKIWSIFYDLVPMLYPEQYLSDPFAASRYDSLVKILPFVDKYLAISETTGKDLTRLIGIPASRVDVIMGGIDTHRWPGDAARIAGPVSITNHSGEIFHLRAPFWLYVGGGDFRKNIKGLIEAFGLVIKAGISPVPQLVIACHIPAELRETLYAEAETFGLKGGRDVIITGWIDDESLALCYRSAFATVFPSLYEGLGLPVLESYYFGAPALASQTSSLREITAPECQFDPTSADSIAQAMLRMHQDPTLRTVSLAYGEEMLKLCNWPAIANHVAELLETDLARSS
jgi:glycosyltransferase involved in cell wall biosynthesis